MRTLKYISFLTLLLFFSLASCKKESQKEDIRRIVSEWTGKEVKFPDNVPCRSLDKDTFCISTTNSSHKILLYVDSAGCTNCRLRLGDWKQLIAEAESQFPGEVDFLFFFQPKEKDLRGLSFLFKQEDFRHPVFIDKENRIGQMNRFPSQTEFQCFLLDPDNKVTLVGNPSLNPKIWELYKQGITGKAAPKPEKQTLALPLTTQHEIRDMEVGKTYTTVFEIENTGDFPLVIADIKSSCGCTVPSWSKQPVASGGKTEVKVEVIPDTRGFFNKTISIYGNMTNSPLQLSIIGTVKKQNN